MELKNRIERARAREELLTVDEATRFFRVSKPTLLGALKRGELPASEPFLIWENRRKSVDSGLRRILFDAGLEKWPKLIQNLRSSCENDWIRDGIPPHVVASWIGHSVRTQEVYYLRVLPEYFDRVVA